MKEEFGPPVGKKREDSSPGVKERLDYLCDLLGITGHDLDNIRYQLLHRTASALIEADRFCAKQALMLVHSFSQTHKWFYDYAAFAALFDQDVTPNSPVFAGKRSGKHLYLGWVTGEAEYLNK